MPVVVELRPDPSFLWPSSSSSGQIGHGATKQAAAARARRPPLSRARAAAAARRGGSGSLPRPRTTPPPLGPSPPPAAAALAPATRIWQLGVVELAGLLLGPAELLSGGDKARSFALRAEPLVVLQEGRPAKRHSAQVSNSFHGSIATGYWFYVLSANPSPKL
ncbi:putative uncharacterized protein C1orf229 [Hordeum vulgare subsp. vulgare]|uniref:putative uncharacterized protein C1orf229 n=1 Tax=Hordeum vulgare subsp. vulgare TaxID=112509 RepID=UPI001D1A34C1|nr:putative uncharacterized protein C1orf229 [Hordeum vulgare subsp. vulgare]